MRPKQSGCVSVVLAVIAIAGILPSFADAASHYKVLHKFSGGTDGSTPGDGLIFDAAGNLYGVTGFGGNLSCGNGGCGTVFRLVPNLDGSWTESVLHSFNRDDGYVPSGGLIFDAVGNLYGVTAYGPGNFGVGLVFKLAPNSDGTWTESVLHSFTRNDGEQPSGGLAIDAAGNLYGTTEYGGAYSYTGCDTGCGTVFKLAPNSDGTWTESVLHSFTFVGSDGGIPLGRIILDAAGNLYGTAAYGGMSGGGAVFKLTPNTDGSWTYDELHEFGQRPDGATPLGGLMLDDGGNLYGTTGQGAPSDVGSITAVGWFSGSNQILMEAGLTMCCPSLLTHPAGSRIPASPSTRPGISTARPCMAAVQKRG